jgi:pimeloyl-ACP methyl ester carboxylesterase
MNAEWRYHDPERTVQLVTLSGLHRFTIERLFAAFLCCGLLSVSLVFSGCSGDAPEVESYPGQSAADIEINGVRIRYLDFNPGAPGLPILFIHGYSGAGFEAFYFQDDLGPEYRVIAPDLPGSGWSEKPDIEYSLDYLIDFVAAFADAVSLDTFHLVGHSLGGLIAGYYAIEHSERVERLVLLAPYGLENEMGPVLTFLSNTGPLVDCSFRLHSRATLKLIVDHNIFYKVEKIPQDLVDYLAIASFHTDHAVEALASITRNIIGRSVIADSLDEISMPTLIIWGEEDRVLNFRFAAEFNSGIRGSRLVAIPECGHMLHIECADQVAQAMSGFFSGR